MKLAGLCLATAMTLVASGANALVTNWSATLDGDQANMGLGTGSAGTGSATGTFDDATNTLTWNIEWSGLQGTVTAAHFHEGAAGVNGGVALGIGDLSSPSMGSGMLGAGAAALFLADSLYINIHTSAFGGGEIRGQVLAAAAPIPIPAGFLLLGTALGGLMLTRRKAAA